jgi:hypothetical protein
MGRPAWMQIFFDSNRTILSGAGIGRCRGDDYPNEYLGLVDC